MNVARYAIAVLGVACAGAPACASDPHDDGAEHPFNSLGQRTGVHLRADESFLY